jgi:hypothetical protein
METDSPAWLAFAAAGDLAELRLLPVPKLTEMVALARELPEARQRIEAADGLADFYRQMQPVPRIEPRGAGPHCAYCRATAGDAELFNDNGGDDTAPDKWACRNDEACLARHDERLRQMGYEPDPPAPVSVREMRERGQDTLRRARSAKIALHVWMDELADEIAKKAAAAQPPQPVTVPAPVPEITVDPWGHILGANRMHTAGAYRGHTLGNPANRSHLAGR